VGRKLSTKKEKEKFKIAARKLTALNLRKGTGKMEIAE